MRINLVKIGNSRGLRLPKAVIDSCGIGTSVTLEIRGQELIIRPETAARAHWEDALVKNPDVETWAEWEAISPSSDAEWTWSKDQTFSKTDLRPENETEREEFTWPDSLLVSKSG